MTRRGPRTAVCWLFGCAYVADRKPQIRAEAGRGPIHRPGDEAGADFGEVTINLRGEPLTCMLFAFRLSFSGEAVRRIFASDGSEAFLEGHDPAGGVMFVYALTPLPAPAGH